MEFFELLSNKHFLCAIVLVFIFWGLFLCTLFSDEIDDYLDEKIKDLEK